MLSFDNSVAWVNHIFTWATALDIRLNMFKATFPRIKIRKLTRVIGPVHGIDDYTVGIV